MEIRIKETGQVMFWNEFRDLLLEQNPSELITVAPQTQEWLSAHGADMILEGPQASGGTVYQFSQRSGVEEINGQWFTKYILGPIFTDQTINGSIKTAAEQGVEYKALKDAEQAKIMRTERNKLLAESDWTQLPDAPVDVVAWTTYRQALRDISNQEGFPWNIVWPAKPE